MHQPIIWYQQLVPGVWFVNVSVQVLTVKCLLIAAFLSISVKQQHDKLLFGQKLICNVFLWIWLMHLLYNSGIAVEHFRPIQAVTSYSMSPLCSCQSIVIHGVDPIQLAALLFVLLLSWVSCLHFFFLFLVFTRSTQTLPTRYRNDSLCHL